MAKKKKRSGGGGGGGGGGVQQQQKPVEEGEDQASIAGDASGEAPGAEDNKDEGKDKVQEKAKDKDGKKPPPPLPVVTAVLKVEMHCDGCAKRIRGSVHRYPGVEGVAMEVDKGTMTVVGRLDAKKLRDRVADKTRKKVDLVGNNNNNKQGGGGGGNNKQGGGGGQHKGGSEEDVKQAEKEHGGGEQEGKEKDGDDPLQEEDKGKDNNKGGGNGGGGAGAGKGKGGGGGGKDNKKPVVPVVATVVLKIGSTGLHCEGCMNRIRSKLYKIKGVEQVSMDMVKNQVTVTGTMDAKALPEKLRKKLRRPVDVVVAAAGKLDGKDKDGGGGGGGKDGKDAVAKALAAELEAWKAAFYDQQSLSNAELMLSDENPNACAVV